MRKIRDEERERWFMSYVMPEPNTGCWLWMGHCNRKGYGTTRGTLAHRVSYQLFRGEIPADKHVLHDCDTPTCVNPAHLHLGTDLDNARERDSKGRRVVPKGEKNWTAGITDYQAEQIRKMRQHGDRLSKISLTVGANISTVKRVLYAMGRFSNTERTYYGGKHYIGADQ